MHIQLQPHMHLVGDPSWSPGGVSHEVTLRRGLSGWISQEGPRRRLSQKGSLRSTGSTSSTSSTSSTGSTRSTGSTSSTSSTFCHHHSQNFACRLISFAEIRTGPLSVPQDSGLAGDHSQKTPDWPMITPTEFLTDRPVGNSVGVIIGLSGVFWE